MQKSKIAGLPRSIRDELNKRLDDSESTNSLLEWLNSLPEVQELCAKEFQGHLVKQQNLDGWKTTGFRNWQLHQAALNFTNDTLPDDLDPALLEKMGTKLLHFLQLRYAAVAGSLPAPGENPEAELRRLSDLCNNLTAMRRGDHSAERLAIEKQRLSLEKSRADAEMEKQFWEWTKRPDIQVRLYPHHDPEQHKREVDRMLSQKLLGTPPRNGHVEIADPSSASI
jgi:hypothetical protein